MTNDNLDRVLWINEALVLIASSFLGLVAAGFLVGSVYRAMQNMSYTTPPPMSPAEINLAVMGVALGGVVLILGVWGRHCALTRNATLADRVDPWVRLTPTVTPSRSRDVAVSPSVDDEELVPASVSSTV